jgi:hypothetical protein
LSAGETHFPATGGECPWHQEGARTEEAEKEMDVLEMEWIFGNERRSFCKPTLVAVVMDELKPELRRELKLKLKLLIQTRNVIKGFG